MAAASGTTPPRVAVVQHTAVCPPGRVGYWHVGVPPSGPFDSRAFQLGNRLLGNEAQAAGLEITLRGPTLRFNQACSFVLSGAPLAATLDSQPLAMHQVLHAQAGQILPR